MVWLENSLAGWWRKDPAHFYFPGFGLLAALLAVYLIGALVTTFAGRWIWRRVDRLLERLPLLGMAYQSIKEILGYDSGRDRFFQGVVVVPVDGGYELGLITGDAPAVDGVAHKLVFVPGSPNPATGRMVLVAEGGMQRLRVRPAEVLRTLVAIGKSPLPTD